MYSTFDKAIAGLILGIVGVVNYFAPGLHIGVSADTVNIILTTITPLIVYLVPNLPKDS